jgi:hypothetical protein
MAEERLCVCRQNETPDNHPLTNWWMIVGDFDESMALACSMCAEFHNSRSLRFPSGTSHAYTGVPSVCWRCVLAATEEGRARCKMANQDQVFSAAPEGRAIFSERSRQYPRVSIAQQAVRDWLGRPKTDDARIGRLPWRGVVDQCTLPWPPLRFAESPPAGVLSVRSPVLIPCNGRVSGREKGAPDVEAQRSCSRDCPRKLAVHRLWRVATARSVC